MRQVLTDKQVAIECSMYKPYPMQYKLNDLQQRQAGLFKKGSKLNHFYKNASGSRPESSFAQASAMSGLKNTNLVKALALRLEEVSDNGGDVNTEVEQAINESEVLQAAIAQMFNNGVNAAMIEEKAEQMTQEALEDAEREMTVSDYGEAGNRERCSSDQNARAQSHCKASQ